MLNVASDIEIVHLILQASLVVKVVMGILVAASLDVVVVHFCEALHGAKRQEAGRGIRTGILVGTDLVGLYQRATGGQYEPAGMEKIFEAGFRNTSR